MLKRKVKIWPKTSPHLKMIRNAVIIFSSCFVARGYPMMCDIFSKHQYPASSKNTAHTIYFDSTLCRFFWSQSSSYRVYQEFILHTSLLNLGRWLLWVNIRLFTIRSLIFDMFLFKNILSLEKFSTMHDEMLTAANFTLIKT